MGPSGAPGPGDLPLNCGGLEVGQRGEDPLPEARETWSIFSFTKPGFFRSPVFGHLSCFGWPKGGDFGERMRCLGCFVG